MVYLWISLAIVVIVVVLLVGFVVPRRRRAAPPPPSSVEGHPPVDDTVASRPPGAAVDTVSPGEAPAAPAIETPEPTAGRLLRLRARLARSQSTLGRGLLSALSRENLDEQAWEDVEEALLSADVGVGATTEIVDRLKTRTKVLGTRSQGELRALLAEELVSALQPDMDRTLHTVSTSDRPAVVLVVGVNGTGKTTTCGKLARVLVADGRTVLLGAADTFRAAAADQLQTWGSRVGAETVCGSEGGDPASVAFDAVKQGTAARVDAATGQNGLTQARVFTEVVDVTGIVLTKLDGTAKGGIVISVQRELGVPVKLIGLGEGADDLAPFDPEQFVDALLGEQ